MKTEHVAIIRGKKSIGCRHLESDPSIRIYAFRIWGKIYWSGDVETLRASKHEAFTDARAMKALYASRTTQHA